jgi:hypothetical protein
MVVTTRARKQEPASLEQLHSAMDAEDEEFCYATLNDHEADFDDHKGDFEVEQDIRTAMKEEEEEEEEEDEEEVVARDSESKGESKTSEDKETTTPKETVPKKHSTRKKTTKEVVCLDDLSEDEEEDEATLLADLLDEKVVKAVMNANIVEETRKGYRRSLQRFIVYLFGKRNKKENSEQFLVLHKDLLEDMKKEKGKGSQARLRDIAEEHLLRASPEYHPIDLFRLDPHTFIGFLCSLSDTKENEFKVSYGGHRSALTYLFTTTEITPPALFYQKMKQGMMGLKNKSAAARGDKGGKLSEGKEPMPFEVYRAICKWLIEDGSAESMFGHCFLTSTWNLMCRSRNTVYIRLEHMGWENDAMTIQFAHTKTDRAGEDAGRKRHIFANPDIPEICPILS